jgi:hypothetical protein
MLFHGSPAAVMEALFDTLVEGRFDIDSRCLIRSPTHMPVLLFGVLPALPHELQVREGGRRRAGGASVWLRLRRDEGGFCVACGASSLSQACVMSVSRGSVGIHTAHTHTHTHKLSHTGTLF